MMLASLQVQLDAQAAPRRRKLLVLDVNGLLLWRVFRKGPVNPKLPPPDAHSSGDDCDPAVLLSTLRAARAAQRKRKKETRKASKQAGAPRRSMADDGAAGLRARQARGCSIFLSSLLGCVVREPKS